jgi:dihydroorotase
MLKIFIKNGLIVDNEIYRADVFINDGIIKYITKPNEMNDFIKKIDPKDVKIIDAEGQYVLPGLVDIHCHLREPGFEAKETIKTGTKAAAAGGFTDIACMPNTNPVIDNKFVVEYLKFKIKEESCVNVYPIGAVTKGQNGEELAEIGKLAEAGVVAISDDGKPVMSPRIMKNAVLYSSMFGIPVISHCEEDSLVDGGQMHEGFVSTELGLKGISPLAEEVMVARDIAIAQTLGIHIHLAHISTKNSVALIRDAKKRGVKITAETCPHYFSLNCEEAYGYNTYSKVNPPLREDEDIEAIIEGLIDGTLDCIATDHAPHTKEDKEIEFDRAANGISGFETALSVAYTYLVKQNLIDMPKLVELMTIKPSGIINIGRGFIKKGEAANITIFNPDTEWTVDSSKFVSKGRNTPFNGKQLNGKVTHTIANGKLAYIMKK